ncbi:MAG: LPS biosynthesis O-acetyl transferase [Nitrospirales bacterium]|nr:MAG: LPS biosynthesis O-acetyl transferase [Nitrospirales bacterium]
MTALDMRSDLESLGDNTFIHDNAEIRRPQLFSIGNNSAIDYGFYCTVAAKLGDHIHIGPHVSVIGGAQGKLSMSHFSNLSAGCRVVCGTDDFLGGGLIGACIPDEFKDSQTISPISLAKFVNVGTNVIILPGLELAEGTVIAANSLVTQSTEPWTIYMGSPAKPYKAREKEKMINFAKKMGY